MQTIALYLKEPLALEAKGSITSVSKDHHGSYIVTDVTPAYPQGGGQEGDAGLIAKQGVGIPFSTIKHVEGEIRHYLENAQHPFGVGDEVMIQVDSNARWVHSVLHTAGHLIASLAHHLMPGLMPVKGHHFTSGSYVEFSGEEQPSMVELEQYLKAGIKLSLNADVPVTYRNATLEDLGTSPFIPEELPHGSVLRLVTISGFYAMPCGGTHVGNLNEIAKIEVTKLKWQKGFLRISYNCA